MQASSPAVAGVAPAAFVGMLRSCLIPAFLCVALAHVAVLAIFVGASHVPAPRVVQSSAIVAQLLRLQAVTPAVAVQSHPEPSPKRTQAEPDRPHVSPSPARAPQPHVVPAPTVPAAARSATPSPAPVQASAQPSPPAANASPRTTQRAAGAANPSPAAPSAPGAAGTQETIAVAAPKHVEHADCRIVKPAYPELSKRRDETGTATVRFVIGTTGAIDTVTLVKSSGFARLDDAALQALRESTCQPYLENGAPIRASYVQAFTFGLDDD